MTSSDALSGLDAKDSVFYTIYWPASRQRDKQTTVDLLEVRALYEEAMILLRHTADVVGEYVQIHREMEAEMKQSMGGW